MSKCYNHPIKTKEYSFLNSVKLITDRNDESICTFSCLDENRTSFVNDIIRRSNAFDELMVFAQYIRDNTIDDGCRNLCNQMIEKYTLLRPL